MEKDWIAVYSTTKEYRSGIAKRILEENNIESIIINKKDSVYLESVNKLLVFVQNVRDQGARTERSELLNTFKIINVVKNILNRGILMYLRI